MWFQILVGWCLFRKIFGVCVHVLLDNIIVVRGVFYARVVRFWSFLLFGVRSRLVLLIVYHGIFKDRVRGFYGFLRVRVNYLHVF